jgi:hypothetical protein
MTMVALLLVSLAKDGSPGLTATLLISKHVRLMLQTCPFKMATSMVKLKSASCWARSLVVSQMSLMQLKAQ